jgi:hypothetical protein
MNLQCVQLPEISVGLADRRIHDDVVCCPTN